MKLSVYIRMTRMTQRPLLFITNCIMHFHYNLYRKYNTTLHSHTFKLTTSHTTQGHIPQNHNVCVIYKIFPAMCTYPQ